MHINQLLTADLGFEVIKNFLLEQCHCSITSERIQKIKPTSDLDKIRKIQDKNDELLHSINRGENNPLRDFPNILLWLSKLKVEGNRLNPDQFKELRIHLELSRKIKQFCDPEKFPIWHEFTGELIELSSGEKEIDRIFDDEYHIKSTASAELKKIRKQISGLEASIQRRMQDIFSEALSHKWLHGDKIVWLEGKLAIPMSATHKRKIKGIIHSQSATGQTVFVEPLEIVERNNDLTELKIAEKAELQRILKELTSFFRPYQWEIELSFEILVQFDLHGTFAKLARQLKCTKPQFSRAGRIEIADGKNPLLTFSKKDVIPLNMQLTGAERILLLSGPNAGGKTVTLKTLGLFALMAQCGLFVPAKRVILPIFTRIVADIGDQQSIENDLSTFSAHVQNIKNILEYSDKFTLVLMDELGTGTDPDAGAALSRALLENLLKTKSHVIATSHLGILKMWAHDTPGIVNGGMIFDPDKLAPTYELNIGQPGGSFAIEISKRIGLQEGIIRRAQELIGDSSVQLENLLNQLEVEQVRAEKLREDMEVREHTLKRKEEKSRLQQIEINREFKQAQRNAYREARQIVLESRKKSENLIKNIKQQQADKESIKIAKKSYSSKLEYFDKELDVIAEIPKISLKKGTVVKDARVAIPHLNATGVVVYPADKQNKVTVEINGKRLRLNLKQLSQAPPEKEDKADENYSGSINVSKPKSFQIDLRGMRVDEALSEVENFLDSALLSGLKVVDILHGKGTGALQEAIQSYLKQVEFVKSYNYAVPELGGAGITVVEL